MANARFNVRIKNKRDVESNWRANNPILLNGELCVVDMSDGTVRYKLGDGVNDFSSLPFVDEELRSLIDAITYKIQVTTQSEYDALTTKDSNTLYVIEV